MSVNIDLEGGTCAIELNGNHSEMPIRDIVISTDDGLRASVIRSPAGDALISEDEAQVLVGAGAKDDRHNVIAD
ncbi:hypothetical protein PSm6_48310 [Pseudomonas solani]|jgi:hypothetical protein|uniref:DUF3203 family protein n=1 Tax=Pseudomonas solani TaxID=2731552 RepID=A0AAU7XWI5_9PSED|nr:MULTISPECIES: DUF3203 family protein [Pseudomonas]EQM67984.1 hypothetical protein L682_20210 [Pseudomonas alcaligenes OT 69]MBB4820778.1 hypothetical protein [Pseudomonas alcaligenes]MDN4149386.1 DUF3203 family protein [Pseudomonas tohonis]WCD83151.1 DUF3203 family protein [Pseudomonas sp. TUM22785]BCD88424.1 hypothetical protein PSm6_48310 [Pseudomonas solani]